MILQRLQEAWQQNAICVCRHCMVGYWNDHIVSQNSGAAKTHIKVCYGTANMQEAQEEHNAPEDVIPYLGPCDLRLLPR